MSEAEGPVIPEPGNVTEADRRAIEARESFLKLIDDVPTMVLSVRTASGQFDWVGQVKMEAFRAANSIEQWQRSATEEDRELLRIRLARIAALAWRAARELGVEDEIPF